MSAPASRWIRLFVLVALAGLAPPASLGAPPPARDTGREGCDPGYAPRPNMGLKEPAGGAGCPRGMSLVAGAFCMDRYEAFLVELGPDGREWAWSPYQNPGERPVRARSAPGAVPQGYVSQVQARRACQATGKRLCRDDEWLAACRGAAHHVYPYGDQRRPGACNDARRRHPAIELYGTREPWIWARLGNACINQLDEGLARTGTHPDCASDDGIYDLMGNLHEWTADPQGTFRGGYYVDTKGNGEGCLYRTGAHGVGYWDYSTGFRCCADL